MMNGQPVIFPNITVGVNASVLGPVVVGENTASVTTAIAMKDTPSNAIVGGTNRVLGYAR